VAAKDHGAAGGVVGAGVLLGSERGAEQGHRDGRWRGSKVDSGSRWRAWAPLIVKGLP